MVGKRQDLSMEPILSVYFYIPRSKFNGNVERCDYDWPTEVQDKRDLVEFCRTVYEVPTLLLLDQGSGLIRSISTRFPLDFN